VLDYRAPSDDADEHATVIDHRHEALSLHTRDQLLEASRVYDNEVYDRSIDVQVLRLRRKIEADPSQPRFIVTERGVGYIFNAPVEILY